MTSFDQLIEDGKVIGPVVEVARAGNGVAVKEGAPRPDIGTVEGAVAKGEVEIGIQQTNVIQPVAGTTYLGPLPPRS